MNNKLNLAATVDVTIDEEAVSRDQYTGAGNRKEREEWFTDQALGMFIHWSIDSQIGSVISHGMVAASDRIVEQYINDLPQTFNPDRFNPDNFSLLAKTVGMKYAVFTTKHHAGFCMYDTKTTPYNVMNTPYSKDITRMFLDSFRKHGIGAGVYFSPLDFYWLHQNNKVIQFLCDDVRPECNPGLMACNKSQLYELMNNYGDIDLLFFDGPPAELKEMAWYIQNNVVITRGAMETPEQELPVKAMPGPWETCHTIGTQWNYKATNDQNKTGTELIKLLIETRAKGGNLLLNVTPDPYGCLPAGQEEVLRELGLWLFYNNPAIYEVRPWQIVREGDVWFTKAKNENTVFAIDTGTIWPHRQWHEITLKSIKTTAMTEIKLLGQNELVIEHQYDVDVKTKWTQDKNGLHIKGMRSYRPYGNCSWSNPVVIEITNCEPEQG